MQKRDILEIKRGFKKDDGTLLRVCGCYVNTNKEKVTTFNESLYSLEDEVLHKYIEISKKLLSGNLGDNILELPFPLEAENGGMQQFFMGLVDSELKNDELCDRLYDRIIETLDHPDDYLILLYFGVYDVPLKTSDNLKLDESEEVFSFMLGGICPVDLSKAGLGYLKETNTIGPRIRDRVVGLPQLGFMFPTFSDRSSDIHSLTYYVKDPKDSHSSFVEDGLGTGSKRTRTENMNGVHAVIRRAINPVISECEETMIAIQESLKDKIPSYVDEDGEEVFEDDFMLTDELLVGALEENDIPGSVCQQIREEVESYLEGEALKVCDVIDEKKLKAIERQQQIENLQSEKQQLVVENKELSEELVNKTFEAVADKESQMDESSGFSQAYDIILRVKPQKAGKVTAKNVDGQKCIVIPVEEDEYINLNGVNTKL
ncbi:MAG: DUF4317 domain-containing protein [Lachnospiraceae bacterium]|nr:DUF4317 domain-containing protein [Lachnospiraceae bacterium]